MKYVEEIMMSYFIGDRFELYRGDKPVCLINNETLTLFLSDLSHGENMKFHFNKIIRTLEKLDV